MVTSRTFFAGGSWGASLNPGVATSNFFFSFIVFLPFGFLLFILTADPVSFVRFLQKRISCFILFCASWVLSCEFTLSKEKNFDKTLCLFRLLLHENYCSSARFRWRQKCRFWIPRCLPFCALFLFWLSRFYKLSFRLFIPTFQCGKVRDLSEISRGEGR